MHALDHTGGGQGRKGDLLSGCCTLPRRLACAGAGATVGAFAAASAPGEGRTRSSAARAAGLERQPLVAVGRLYNYRQQQGQYGGNPRLAQFLTVKVQAA
jgi:hypothetical protein